MLFHDVIRYIDSMLSRIHANTTYLLNVTCMLVVKGMRLGTLECM